MVQLAVIGTVEVYEEGGRTVEGEDVTLKLSIEQGVLMYLVIESLRKNWSERFPLWEKCTGRHFHCFLSYPIFEIAEVEGGFVGKLYSFKVEGGSRKGMVEDFHSIVHLIGEFWKISKNSVVEGSKGICGVVHCIEVDANDLPSVNEVDQLMKRYETEPALKSLCDQVYAILKQIPSPAPLEKQRRLPIQQMKSSQPFHSLIKRPKPIYRIKHEKTKGKLRITITKSLESL